MTVNQVVALLNEFAPLQHAEDFDNVGLLVGNKNMEVSGILVTLDTLENVVDEAIATNCNLIVSFHPIIFSGLKKLTGKNYVERVVIKAIKKDIAIFSMHTALDNSKLGVNAKICEVLGIQNPTFLIPKKNTIKKLVTYVPKESLTLLKEVLFKAGAGDIGNYSNCSFSTSGKGTFKPNEHANPAKGKVNELQEEEEAQLHVIFDSALEQEILKVLHDAHPYEEVAYELITLENTNQNLGIGMVGELEYTMEEKEFLYFLKTRMNTPLVRHSALINKPIKRVAVLGGSGAFGIGSAKNAKADAFVTADMKYHQFYEAENQLLIADIGHYETEQFTKNLLVDFLTKKIPNFAVTLSQSVTNPVKYF